MEIETFKKYLKKSGKKDHVVQGLIRQVQEFESHLASTPGRSLDNSQTQDLLDYASLLDSRKPGSAKNAVRGLVLYFQHIGKQELATLAHEIRQQAIAKTRRIFPLREFRGVNPDHIERLKRSGIENVEQMLEAGATPAKRKCLVEDTGVPLSNILELVKLSDLSRIGGLKGIRARLYHDSGVDTPEKIAQWEPETLRAFLEHFVQETGFNGIPPLPKEVRNAVRVSRNLDKIVQYEAG